MALIDYVDPESADEQVADVFSAEAKTYGQPSLFSRMLANNPAVLTARTEYAATLTEGGDVEAVLKELVYVAVSQENECDYCTASHTEYLLERTDVSESLVEAVASDESDALDARQRAVVSLARQMARNPKRVTEDHLDALADVGFDDADVIELVVSAAAAIAANTIMDTVNVTPADRDDAFATYVEYGGEAEE